jgi:16S rRNA processing protein RimM
VNEETPRRKAPSPPAGILVGWIRRPHGIRGEVRVEVESDNPERFDPGAELTLRLPGGACRRVEIVSSRFDKDSLLVQFAGIGDRDAVEGWRNARLEIDESALPDLPAGEIYVFELVGCECFDKGAGHLGKVSEVIEDGGGLLMLVEKDGRVLPIPYVKALVPEVDVHARRIGVELPEGLIEACLQTPA